MYRKRTKRSPQKRKNDSSGRGKITRDPHSSQALQARIMDSLAQVGTSMTTDGLLEKLQLAGFYRPRLQSVLLGLERDKRVLRDEDGYSLTTPKGLLKGQLSMTGRGFGFVVLADSSEPDIFIARGDLQGALHGDEVLVSRLPGSERRPSGVVAQVFKRKITRLCGLYTCAGDCGYVTPDDDRLDMKVLIRAGHRLGALNHQAVWVEIIEYDAKGQGPEGKVLKVLGAPEQVSVQVEMGMLGGGLAEGFPEAVIAETTALTPLTACEAGREDLRELCQVTIDGATARDFDDAVGVVAHEHGYTLWVSIADVAYYVKPGSPLDQEAYQRGTSIYLPDRVLPMLPERLSNDLCSLRPDCDRPAMTVRIEFDLTGQRLSSRFYRSLIRSQKRLTYDQVNHFFNDEDDLGYQGDEVVPVMLRAAEKLAVRLSEIRTARGSISFTIPGPGIRVEDDEVVAMDRIGLTTAQGVIESFMLAANEAVAAALGKADQPVLYRIHEQPDASRVDQFVQTAEVLGLSLPAYDEKPAWFEGVLESVKGLPMDYTLNTLLLRTMQQARYAPEDLGHFGLAAPHYLHFTSPIRRYPDLVAHRALIDHLTGGTGTDCFAPTALEKAATTLSDRERVAIGIERDLQARLAVLFLHDRVGESFAAVISGVTPFALFVELRDLFIGGGVPLRDLTDDYYVHDPKAHLVRGERRGQVYQLGDAVQVKLVRADFQSKRLTFILDADEKAS